MFARLVVDELRTAVPALAPVLRSEPLDPLPESAEAKANAVVSPDGSGTHTTIQAAIAAAPDNGTKPFVILVKPGTYQGQIVVPHEKRFVHLVGEETPNTVLTYAFNVKETPPGTNLAYKGTGV